MNIPWVTFCRVATVTPEAIHLDSLGYDKLPDILDCCGVRGLQQLAPRVWRQPVRLPFCFLNTIVYFVSHLIQAATNLAGLEHLATPLSTTRAFW